MAQTTSEGTNRVPDVERVEVLLGYADRAGWHVSLPGYRFEVLMERRRDTIPLTYRVDGVTVIDALPTALKPQLAETLRAALEQMYQARVEGCSALKFG